MRNTRCFFLLLAYVISIFSYAKMLTYQAEEGEIKVQFVSSYNRWNSETAPTFKGPDDHNQFHLNLELPAGQYSYKLLINDTEWILDPANPDYIYDENGHNRNSQLTIDAAYQKVPKIILANIASMIDFDLDIRHIRVYENHFSIYLSTIKGSFNSIRLREQSFEKIGLYNNRDYWYLSADSLSLLEEFLLEFNTEHGTYYYTNQYQDYQPETIKLNTPQFVMSNHPWGKQAIWYQIFIDRFYNGSKKNDDPFYYAWDQGWEYHPREGKDYWHEVWLMHFGGDLIGIKKKMNYLKDLGINTLYLTPVQEGPSPHRYDPASYIHVDNNLVYKKSKKNQTEDFKKWTKSDKYFLKLIKKLRKNDMRLIMDGVYNHCGNEHPIFLNAQKGIAPYDGWFEFEDDNREQYSSFAGNMAMPAFNRKNNQYPKTLEKYLFKCTERWTNPDNKKQTNDGVDGWRMDTAQEMPDDFWKKWNHWIHREYPDVYTVGEYWGTGEKAINELGFDAVTNYNFYPIVLDYFTFNCSKNEFLIRLKNYEHRYLRNFNSIPTMLDSHDKPRIYTQIQRKLPNYSRDFTQTCYHALLTFQYLYPQPPYIYYGDEILSTGHRDPFNRKPMDWNWQQDPEKAKTRTYVKELISIRKKIFGNNAEAFISFEPLPESDLLKIKLETEQSTGIIFFNFSSNQTKIPVQKIDTSAEIITWSFNQGSIIINKQIQKNIEGMQAIGILRSKGAK